MIETSFINWGYLLLSDRSIAILSISSNPAVSETRRMVLEQRGYKVAEAADFHEISDQCSNTHYGCAVVGTDIDPKMKRAIAAVLEKLCPGLPILEICRISPEIPGAAMLDSDSPEALVKAVDDLLLPSGSRYTEQLHRRAAAIRERAAQSLDRVRQTRARARKFVVQSRKMVDKWKSNKGATES